MIIMMAMNDLVRYLLGYLVSWPWPVLSVCLSVSFGWLSPRQASLNLSRFLGTAAGTFCLLSKVWLLTHLCMDGIYTLDTLIAHRLALADEIGLFFRFCLGTWEWEFRCGEWLVVMPNGQVGFGVAGCWSGAHQGSLVCLVIDTTLLPSAWELKGGLL
ncbi:hypothetical protein QBC34DRAFT_173473 [Podospora aff. communis PSN243]|uniref:Uncharacterized protein n=1 Tax=Podospora aff. communis PSN243 TaxID=3040156 RepID=A0AAV9H1G7_9PEZI|nr:hypothetical protein QBC34DRAFT_173473 [Podospora aff. communis PSN243]